MGRIGSCRTASYKIYCAIRKSITVLNGLISLLMLMVLGVGTPPVRSAMPAATEQQLKAVFVFNFSHFVGWPQSSFATPNAPFVICVLGGEEFADELEMTVRGEQVSQHPLQVLRAGAMKEPGDCHILYIDKTAAQSLDDILAAVDGRGTLTVSDLDGASRRGVMIQLATENNRIRLLINVESARAAGLTISSNLLRPARIVRTGGQEP